MESPGNIFLVGPMGAGKTTIGKRLATALELPFYDSDHAIEEQTGASIPWIFDIEGESGFREREQRMIDTLTSQQNIVLATGGGAVLNPQNRTNMHNRGRVIYLRCPVKNQLERTRMDRNRPLLQTGDPRARLQTLFEERDPLYTELADINNDTHTHNTRNVVKKILQQLANTPPRQAQ